MMHLLFFFDYELLQATVDLCLGVKYSFPIHSFNTYWNFTILFSGLMVI